MLYSKAVPLCPLLAHGLDSPCDYLRQQDPILSILSILHWSYTDVLPDCQLLDCKVDNVVKLRIDALPGVSQNQLSLAARMHCTQCQLTHSTAKLVNFKSYFAEFQITVKRLSGLWQKSVTERFNATCAALLPNATSVIAINSRKRTYRTING